MAALLRLPARQRQVVAQGYPFNGPQDRRRQLLTSAAAAPAAGQDIMVIHPAALPSGAGLQIAALFPHGTFNGWSVSLVQASPQCTGS
jgi:hypothetical protein